MQAAEKELDDDAESIITNERYVYISSIIKGCYKKKNAGKLSTSDKIDKIVTNRFAGPADLCGGHVYRVLSCLCPRWAPGLRTGPTTACLETAGSTCWAWARSSYEEAAEEYAVPGSD